VRPFQARCAQRGLWALPAASQMVRRRTSCGYRPAGFAASTQRAAFPHGKGVPVDLVSDWERDDRRAGPLESGLAWTEACGLSEEQVEARLFRQVGYSELLLRAAIDFPWFATGAAKRSA
jgi:hypothetical protein